MKNIFYKTLIICALLMSSILLKAQIRDTTLLVRTRGSLAYLNYGLGQDRLGGAKMGYIDSLVLLRVSGVYQDQYRVRLTPALSAWIPKTAVKKDSTTKSPVQNLTGSWRVWGDTHHDYLSIVLPERLPYQCHQELSPSRIVIDVFGATTNTNWITQMQTVKEIKNVEYEQVADEQLRVYVYLKNPQHWGYAIGYQGRRLVLKVTRQPQKLKLRYLTVALDPGHGGTNLGAQGLRSKIYEKDLNLSIVRKLKAHLEKAGARVILTRSSDTLIGNNDRVLVMRNTPPDVLVSIHNNAAGDTVKVKGTSTYYKHLGYRPLSTAILSRLLALGVEEYGNIGRFNFTLNSPTEYPNVLVEGLFMSQADDEKKLLNEQFQDEMAQKIVLGLKDWLKTVQRQSRRSKRLY
jgi:N-acetylmuramoyl-L-alanine amidase